MTVKGVLKTVFSLVVLAAIAAFLAWVYVERHKEPSKDTEEKEGEKEASHASVEGGEGALTFDQAAQARCGIGIETLKPATHRQEIKVYGTVQALDGLLDLRKSLLDLRKNLVDLQNSRAAALAQVERAKVDLELSKKEYERLKALHTDNQNVSDKAVQATEAAWRTNEVNLSAAQESCSAAQKALEIAQQGLAHLEDSARQQWGDVLTKWLFDSAPQLARILQGQEVLILVTLPLDAPVDLAPPTARIQTAVGTFASVQLVTVSPRVDPRLQGQSLFYTAPAPTPGLTPGMNFTAYLPQGTELKGVMVPKEAIVLWQGKAWVYVRKDTGHFARRETATDVPAAEGWFVTQGLAPGDSIVVKGAQLLLSEEFRSQIKETEGG